MGPGDGAGRVVVLDDNLFLLPRLESDLRNAGFEPVLASSAARLRALIAERPAAVLVNLAARAFDAPVLVGEIRAAHAGVPVLGYGPHADEPLAARGLAAGCAEVVPNGLVVRAAGQLVARHRAAQRDV